MKRHIFLVRHGEKGREGSEQTNLTPRGKKQVALLAKRLNTLKQRKRGTKDTLEKIQFDAIVSSDLPRCVQTTKIVNKTLGIRNVSYESYLREIGKRALTSRFSHAKQKKAIRKFYKELLNGSGNILIVASGNVNKYIISLIWNIPSKKVAMSHVATGINYFTIDEKKKTNIMYLDDCSHLPDKLKISKHMVALDKER